jgi:hypothetical protein
MKGYTVFNAEQIDGLPGHFYATAANVVHGGSQLLGAVRARARARTPPPHRSPRCRDRGFAVLLG